MNCLIWVLLLLYCGNNAGGDCRDNNCGCARRGDRCGSPRRSDDCGCMTDRNSCASDRDNSDNNGCDCRSDFRPEPRFEQRPFKFNQNPGCGCEESANSNCDR